MKKRTCKICKAKYIPEHQTIMALCSAKCIVEYHNRLKEKKANKEHKAAKESLLTKSDYEKVLQTHINSIIRLIDYGCKCISCGNLKRGFAGHYHSVGANRSLRFHLDNIHIQDFNCNGERGGNIPAYSRGLIDWYGKDYKEYVELQLVKDYPVMKWCIDDLKEWIFIAKSIVKELKEKNAYYDAEARLDLRNFFNQQLGIYK
jgi:hypothetical protein